MLENILITGSTGFLGSNLTKALSETQRSVLAMVRANSDTWRLKHLLGNSNLRLITVEELEKEFPNLSIKAIIHTATVYGRQKESLEEMKNANTELPIKLWDLACKNGVGCFINTDTFMTEDLSANDRYYNYARTKKAFLHYVQEHLGRYETKFINFVVYHMYGPADNPEKFLPWIMNQLLKQVPIIGLTKGEQTRDFVFIDDVVRAFLLAVDKYGGFKEFSEFEIGFGKEYSIHTAVELLKKYLDGETLLNWGEKEYQPGEIMHSVANISKNLELGWQASVGLEAGLKKTVEYYKNL